MQLLSYPFLGPFVSVKVFNEPEIELNPWKLWFFFCIWLNYTTFTTLCFGVYCKTAKMKRKNFELCVCIFFWNSEREFCENIGKEDIALFRKEPHGKQIKEISPLTRISRFISINGIKMDIFYAYNYNTYTYYSLVIVWTRSTATWF